MIIHSLSLTDLIKIVWIKQIFKKIKIWEFLLYRCSTSWLLVGCESQLSKKDKEITIADNLSLLLKMDIFKEKFFNVHAL